VFAGAALPGGAVDPYASDGDEGHAARGAGSTVWGAAARAGPLASNIPPTEQASDLPMALRNINVLLSA
jgi:hypothetical protein